MAKKSAEKKGVATQPEERKPPEATGTAVAVRETYEGEGRLVSYTDPPASLPRHQGFIPVQIQRWQDGLVFCKALVDSGFLPKAIKTPQQALSIVLTGQELGLPPMKSLRMIYVVEGLPTMKAELMLAMFRSRGGRAIRRLNDGGRAVWWFRHPSGDELEHTYTIEMAERAGLAGKDNWKKRPQTMLDWRCVAEGLRLIAGDILGALYDPDEVEEVAAEMRSRVAEHTKSATEATRERVEELKADLGGKKPEQGPPGDEVYGRCKGCDSDLTPDTYADEGLCLACAEKAEQGDLEL